LWEGAHHGEQRGRGRAAVGTGPGTGELRVACRNDGWPQTQAPAPRCGNVLVFKL